jgi:hypothetical protein
MHIVIGHPDALVIIKIDIVVVEEEIQYVVPLCVRVGNGPKDPDFIYFSPQCIQDSQRHR